LAAAEFQYNDKQHVVMGKTLFELNFGRHPWKGDLMVKTDIPQVEDLLSGLQRSWEQVTKAMEEAQRSMKKQFDKKRRNSRTEGWRPCVVGKQEYPFKQTLKEAG